MSRMVWRLVNSRRDRLVGEVVMTEHHCRGAKTVSRPIAMGAYGMDSHNARRHVGADGFVRSEGNIAGQKGQLIDIVRHSGLIQ